MADTRDDQVVKVGPDCFKHVRAGGALGWQPPRGGPRLYLPTEHRIVSAGPNAFQCHNCRSLWPAGFDIPFTCMAAHA